MLLVGPRGTGKTHLMALLHQAWTTATAAAARSPLDDPKRRMGIALLDLPTSWPGLACRWRSRRIAPGGETFEARSGPRRDLAEDRAPGGNPGQTWCPARTCTISFEGLGAEGGAVFAARSTLGASSRRPPRSSPTSAARPSRSTASSRSASLEQLSSTRRLSLAARPSWTAGAISRRRWPPPPGERESARSITSSAATTSAYIVPSQYLTKEALDELAAPFMEYMVDDLTPYFLGGAG